MDWKRIVVAAQLNGGVHNKPGEFGPPADRSRLDSLQSTFGNRVPADLLELLSQADGCFEPGGGVFIMCVDEILRANQEARHLQAECSDAIAPLDHILFFADPGTGDYFGYDLSTEGNPIIGWIQIGDERSYKAKDLQELIVGWYSNRIGG